LGLPSYQQLQDQVETLKEMVIQLESKVFGAHEHILPLYFGLTNKESKVLMALYRNNRHLSRDFLLEAAMVDSLGDAPDVKIIDMFIHKMRRKIFDKNLPITIITYRGVGYELSAEGREFLTKVFTEMKEQRNETRMV